MRTNRSYRISDSDANETIQAASMAQAIEAARTWAEGGEYLNRCMRVIRVQQIDPDGGEPIGDYEQIEVEVGPQSEPPETECGADDADHDWQPCAGVRENPGLYSVGGTGYRTEEQCSACGLRKTTLTRGSNRNRGELPQVIRYEMPEF